MRVQVTCSWCKGPASCFIQNAKKTVYCQPSCRSIALATRAETRLRLTFWNRIDKYGPLPLDRSLGPCWLWQGKVNSAGYGAANGRFVMFGWVKGAHRIAYVLANGQLPAGGQVLHKCDVKRCCNPSHLFSGTQKDNAADMFAKGRETPGVLKARPGSAHGYSKLHERDIPRIRDIGRDTKQHVRLAAEYGVSRSHISQIARGKIWRHVP